MMVITSPLITDDSKKLRLSQGQSMLGADESGKCI